MDQTTKNHLQTIQSLKSRDYWQKYCAGEDWFEKDFQYVVKHIVNQNPTFRRKQWEHATIFLNLLNHGMLDGTKVGAAFGAGRERLLFKMLPLTRRFHATDVYSMNTVWATANIHQHNTPYDFVTAAAPEGTNLDNFEVHDMDMRDLSHFEDNSLDFCYSMCAFEHIGHREDFISHLKEVNRVLKPGGIYSMTTEFLFNTETKPIKGNYKFDIEYLRDLFTESGLETADTFDGRCEPNLINSPKPPIDSLSAKALSNHIPTPFLYLEGIPYSTCNFVLKPSADAAPKSFDTIGLEGAAQLMTNRSLLNIKKTFKQWQLLDPYNRLRREVKNYMEDHKEYLVEEGFELNIKDHLVNGLMVYTDFIHFHDHRAAFKIQYDIEGYDHDVVWELVEKDPMRVEGRQTIKKLPSSSHQNQQLMIEFEPNPKKVYALSARVKPNAKNIKIKSILAWAKVFLD